MASLAVIEDEDRLEQANSKVWGQSYDHDLQKRSGLTSAAFLTQKNS
jgi:hypothetical protein